MISNSSKQWASSRKSAVYMAAPQQKLASHALRLLRNYSGHMVCKFEGSRWLLSKAMIASTIDYNLKQHMSRSLENLAGYVDRIMHGHISRRRKKRRRALLVDSFQFSSSRGWPHEACKKADSIPLQPGVLLKPSACWICPCPA